MKLSSGDRARRTLCHVAYRIRREYYLTMNDAGSALLIILFALISPRMRARARRREVNDLFVCVFIASLIAIENKWANQQGEEKQH